MSEKVEKTETKKRRRGGKKKSSPVRYTFKDAPEFTIRPVYGGVELMRNNMALGYYPTLHSAAARVVDIVRQEKNPTIMRDVVQELVRAYTLYAALIQHPAKELEIQLPSTLTEDEIMDALEKLETLKVKFYRTTLKKRRRRKAAPRKTTKKSGEG